MLRLDEIKDNRHNFTFTILQSPREEMEYVFFQDLSMILSPINYLGLALKFQNTVFWKKWYISSKPLELFAGNTSSLQKKNVANYCKKIVWAKYSGKLKYKYFRCKLKIEDLFDAITSALERVIESNKWIQGSSGTQHINFDLIIYELKIT